MMAARLWICAFVALVYIHAVNGLYCISCTNAKNHSECDRVGKVVKCQVNEKSCMIEVRWISNQGKKLVSKGCKQTSACENNLDLKACVEERPNSQCYCCCKTNRCNRGDSRCFPNGDPRLAELTRKSAPPPAAAAPHDVISGRCGRTVPPIRFGTVSCTSSNLVGSRCSYSCQRNFLSNSEQMTLTCTPRGWSSIVPRCELMGCTYRRLDYGVSFCSRGRFDRSTCRHYCRSGRQRVGSFTSTCSFNQRTKVGTWSTPMPTCRARTGPVRIPNCPRLTAPRNGRMSCTRANRPSTLCTFTCNSNYQLVGSQMIGCQRSSMRSSRWTGGRPMCRAINKQCSAAPSLRNGRVVCTQENRLGSVCRFSCNAHYAKRGASYISCTERGHNAQWTPNGLPDCISTRKCRKLTIANSQTLCNQGTDVNSVCTVTCMEGYRMVGVGRITCSSDGIWSSSTTRCLVISCPSLPPSDTMQTTCSNANYPGSVCSFACNAGLLMIGADQVTCQMQDDTADWTVSAPTCLLPTTCDEIVGMPNGIVDCSNSNNVGSNCSFICGETYAMVGPSYTVCNELTPGNGRWSQHLPICKETCLDMPEIRMGTTSCTNDKKVGSVCSFTCQHRYEMIGPVSTSCVKLRNDRARWNNALPRCQVIRCSSLPSSDNMHATCTDGNNPESVCSFACNEGLLMIGADQVTCRLRGNTADWTSSAPICLPPATCDEIVGIPNGIVDCSNSNNVGSQCSFICGETYAMVGASYTVCNEVRPGFGSWSHRLPTCQETCPDIPTILLGTTSCTNDKIVGSVCSFTCQQDYEAIGSATTSCVKIGNDRPRWDNALPRCQMIECNPLGELGQGNFTCSNGNKIRSSCSYTCANEYVLRPASSQSLVCNADKSWDKPVPCCVHQCPDTPKLDIIVVLDSSSSVTLPGWKKMITFVKTALSFYDMGPNGTSVSVFRYNNRVDKESKVTFAYTQKYGKEALLRKIGKIPYDGQGTRTGQALFHALEIINKGVNRPDAVDVVLVLTDGKSQDNVKAPAEALRRKGALTYAIAIQPERGSLNMNQLNDIAGRSHNLFLLERGFASFTEDFAREIRQSVCHDHDICAV